MKKRSEINQKRLDRLLEKPKKPLGTLYGFPIFTTKNYKITDNLLAQTNNGDIVDIGTGRDITSFNLTSYV